MTDYVPPPPPAPRGSDSCWKWGGLACGGGCLLFLVIGVIFFFAAGPRFWKFITNTVNDSVAVQQEMHRVYKGVERYHKDKNAYPNSLKDLVPAYIASESYLKLSTHPDGPEFTYHKPGPHAEPSDVMLEYDIPLTTPDGRSAEVPIMIQVDGMQRQGQTRLPGAGSRVPTPSR